MEFAIIGWPHGRVSPTSKHRDDSAGNNRLGWETLVLLPPCLQLCLKYAESVQTRGICFADIPLSKVVAGVRVGMKGDTIIVNPTVEEQSASPLDLTMAGTADAILMIEGFCDFLTNEQMLKVRLYISCSHISTTVLGTCIELIQNI